MSARRAKAMSARRAKATSARRAKVMSARKAKVMSARKAKVMSVRITKRVRLAKKLLTSNVTNARQRQKRRIDKDQPKYLNSVKNEPIGRIKHACLILPIVLL